MTKLDELWVAFADYQSIADKRGHGESWAKMCELKTEKACSAAASDAAANAAYAAYSYAAVAAAAYAALAVAAAAYAANAAVYAACAAAGYPKYCMQKAIKRINKAIELAEKQND
jgi:Na+/H+-translocating membrane pyrophosphatase